MKLFIREHISLIVLQMVQMITIVSLLWLSEIHVWTTVIYSLILCNFFLICYLIYKYMSRQRFYYILTNKIDSIDESLQHLDQQPISLALNHLLKKQYDLYQAELIALHKKQNEHLTFINRWVHQMKAPLSVIELMAHELDEPEASSLREEVDRLKTGLTTALSMARLRNIEHDFSIKQVNLKSIIQEILSEHRRLFIRHGVYPRTDIADGIFVYTDSKWLHFIVNQLIENALKYSADRTDQLHLSFEQTKGATILSITDYGIGIPPEDIRSIFKPFYTGKNGRLHRESTGVGLYIVKEVVAHLGHDIRVSSKVEEGTTFKITF